MMVNEVARNSKVLERNIFRNINKNIVRNIAQEPSPVYLLSDNRKKYYVNYVNIIRNIARIIARNIIRNIARNIIRYIAKNIIILEV